MSSLGFWSMLAILYQTTLSVMVSWLTLSCKFEPDKAELHEITLLKILYLYDPVACDRVHFYNITSSYSNGMAYASVIWPMSNEIAANFRTKIQLWLSLHVIWTFFAVVNVTLGQRSCGFYAILVPFTLAGTTLLVVDIVNCVMFLIDAMHTYSEAGILQLLAARGHLRGMSRKLRVPKQLVLQDTSWISVLLAYISIRGVVQWIVNFWIVKDTYFDGLTRYRKAPAKPTAQ